MERQDTSRKVLPAEWAPQSAVMLTWPHSNTDWQPILPQITETYVRMAKEIVKRERLMLVTREPKSPFTGHCLLDFQFNGWGSKFEASLDNRINRALFDAGVVNGEYVDDNGFVLEGGSIESDGEGTVFTTTGCLMAPNRNQPLTQDEIEDQLKKRLAADRILWIDHGDLVGDDTDGHIDTLVRVAPADTLLYMGCDDENDEQYEQLHKMEEDLRMLQTKSGRGYRLLRLPSPRPIYYDGEQFLDSP